MRTTYRFDRRCGIALTLLLLCVLMLACQAAPEPTPRPPAPTGSPTTTLTPSPSPTTRLSDADRGATVFANATAAKATFVAGTPTPPQTSVMGRADAVKDRQAGATATVLALTTTPTFTPVPPVMPAVLPSVYDGGLPEGAVARLGRGWLSPESVSPGGEYVVLSTRDGYAVHRTASLEPIWRVSGEGVVKWFPDGQTVALGPVLYDIETGEKVREIPGSPSVVRWSPDGTLFATAANGAVTVRDGATGETLRHIPKPDIEWWYDIGWSVSVAFSPDNSMIAITYWWQCDDMSHGFYQVFVWNVGTGEQVFILDEVLSGPTIHLEWSPDGKRIVTLNPWDPDDVQLWDISTGEQRVLSEEASDFSWSPDGTRIAVVDHGALAMFDASGEHLATLDHPTKIDHVVWSPDGTRIAAGGSKDAPVVVWDAATGEQLYRIDEAGTVVGFGPGGNTLIATLKANYTVATWDIGDPAGSARLLHALRGTASVNALAWSPDGGQILTGAGVYGGGGWVTWDVERAAPVLMVEAKEYIAECDEFEPVVVGVAWSPDGLVLATGLGRATMMLWNAQVGWHLHTLTEAGYRAAFSPDGSLLATAPRVVVQASSERVVIWDVASGLEVQALPAEGARVMDIAWSPDGTQIAVATNSAHDWYDPESSGEIVVRDAASGRQMYRLGGLETGALSVAWSPDGTRIAAGSGRRVAVWNVATKGAAEAPLVLYSNIDSIDPRLGMVGVAWSPDGTQIAAAFGAIPFSMYTHGGSFGTPGQVIVWDTQTAERLYRFKDHVYEVQTVAFSPDGTLLASGSLDGTVILWDVTQ